MEVESALVAAATLLLWLPYPYLSERFRARTAQSRYTPPDLSRVMISAHNHLDFIRAAAGTYFLNQHFFSQPAPENQPLIQALMPYVIVGVGVLIQTVRFLCPLNFVAPIFYLSGVTLGMTGRLEAAFALLFGWAFALGTKQPCFLLPAMGVALALAGFFNGNLNPILIFNAALILTPLLLAMLLHRRLIYFSRDRGYWRKTVAPQKAGKPKVNVEQPPPAPDLAVSQNPQ